MTMSYQVGLLSTPSGPPLLSWWAFSAIFEEGGMLSHPFDKPQWGHLSKDGVAKPVYRAFQLLNGAGTHRLPVDAKGSAQLHALATVASPQERAQLQLYISNFEAIHTGRPCTAKNLTVQIVGANTANTAAKLVRIDSRHSNPLSAWQNQGEPWYMTPAQVASLHKSSELVPQAVAWEHSGGDAMQTTLQLEPNSCAFLNLTFSARAK